MSRARFLTLGVAAIAAASIGSGTARAQTSGFSFSGPGVWGTILLSYGHATDAKYPNAYEVTGISGTFNDTNNGLNISNASIDSLVPINHATGSDPLLPSDFSRFTVTNGLPAQNNGYITFDNLFWPNGSVPVCTAYPFFGGGLDVYGLMFSVGNGQFASIWSNGFPPGSNAADYGVSLSTSASSLDYVSAGVSVTATPEPSSLALLGTGMVGLVGFVRRKMRV